MVAVGTERKNHENGYQISFYSFRERIWHMAANVGVTFMRVKCEITFFKYFVKMIVFFNVFVGLKCNNGENLEFVIVGLLFVIR